MLQFVYEFLYKFIDKKDFNIMYMDTDSIYSAFASDKIEDLIKTEFKSLYEEEKKFMVPQNRYTRKSSCGELTRFKVVEGSQDVKL